jgi:LmbE family N-acetylglucosaminyl deacetylase
MSTAPFPPLLFDFIARPGLAAGFVLGAAILAASCSSPAMAQNTADAKPDSYLLNNRPGDPRYKADILVVVAHPDDEVMVSAYLAREVFDNGKRVAVVYETDGDGGNNDVGPEQAAALGDIRQIEGRRAAASLGITNVWFLGGHDTPSQNVLTSLERCSHGRCLDELVRIVRITRPSVILTWLPDFATGENHADHQASGVLATEAFDMAGDPTALSEQVSPATNPDKNGNLTEGLRPWQPQKLYYFYNPTHDIFAGQGPQYSSQELSPSRHLSYGTLAAQAFAYHLTQGGTKIADEIANNTLGSSTGEISKIVTEPVRLILGKSFVPSGVTDDVFAGIVSGGVPYQRAPGFTATRHSEPSLEIGDPWRYYHQFWQAHGLDHLQSLVPLEISVHVDGTLAIPLVIDNPLDTAIDVSFSVAAPDGWKVTPVAAASVAPHVEYYLRILAAAPATKVPGWQQFTVLARSGNKTIGSVQIRAELSSGWVAPQ